VNCLAFEFMGIPGQKNNGRPLARHYHSLSFKLKRGVSFTKMKGSFVKVGKKHDRPNIKKY